MNLTSLKGGKTGCGSGRLPPRPCEREQSEVGGSRNLIRGIIEEDLTAEPKASSDI